MSSVRIEKRADRKKSPWRVVYYVDGRRRRASFEEEREALNFARQLERGIEPEDEMSISIAEAIQNYYGTESQRKVQKSRVNERRYFNLFHYFMEQERGITKLKSIELRDMEALRDWLPVQTEWLGKPMSMSPQTVNRCLRVLKHFFVKQIHWRKLDETPCRYLAFLPYIETQRLEMTADEYLRMFKAAPDWFKPVLQFMHLTGAPASCVERVTWNDIDLAEGTLYLLRKKGQGRQWKRIPQPITAQARELLELVRQAGVYADGHVFRDYAGRKLLADRVTREANDAIVAAGLRVGRRAGLTAYSIRHALASELTAANVATEIVRQVMGHASIATTQRYANKIGQHPLKGALEIVRGGKAGANSDFEQRTEEVEKLG